MGRISDLSDELVVKILSFLPTKEAVSTSILSKQWEFLWMWVPKLDYDIHDFESELAFREYMNKNLPLHRAPVLERFSLDLGYASFQPDDIKMWTGIAVSRRVRDLSILHSSYLSDSSVFFLPASLYTCEPLVSLILSSETVFVDVPPMVSLPSLKTLKLRGVTYSNEDSLRLLLSYCPVLEDLVIERYEGDNLRGLVVTAPLLQRLSLYISGCSSGGYVIVTPSLKYFKFNAERSDFSYLIEHMPKLEEADISVEDDIEKLLESITSVKRLSLYAFFNSGQESLYSAGIVFNQLEHLKLCVDDCHWPQLLFRFLEDSPKLRDLHIYAYEDQTYFAPFSLNSISVPKCLLESLESFKFEGYQGTSEERDVLSFFFKNACCLKSSSISE